jgi:hypothetical protein
MTARKMMGYLMESQAAGGALRVAGMVVCEVREGEAKGLQL